MTLVLGVGSIVSGQTLYEETFANDAGTLAAVGWTPTGDFTVYGYSGTYYDAGLEDAATSQPINGLSAVYMGSGAEVNEGFFTTDASNSLSGFTDIAFTGSLQFGIYDQIASGAGTSTNETAYFLVLDGGNWYASANAITGPGPSENDYMYHQTMSLSPAAANWVTVSGIGSSSITFGSTPGSNLGGTITGAGVVFTINNTSYYGINYSDFTISKPASTASMLLNIALSGSNLVIFWPSSITNFVLEQISDLTTTNWSTNGLAISDDGTNKSVSIIQTAGSTYFRLISKSAPAHISLKKGIAAYYLADIMNAPLVGGVWAYDWQADFPALPAGVEYVPMLWTYTNQSQSTITTLLNTYKSDGANEVLSFNEPDNGGQANLTVSKALTGYGYMHEANVLPVISPACGDDTDSWMQQFMSGAASDGYNIPAVAVHDYDTNASSFLSYIDTVYNMYGKPLWITEFADTDEPYIDWATTNFTSVGVDDCVAFINAVLPGLESRPYVVRYSWYCQATGSSSPSSQGLGTAALWNSDKTLTEVGAAYKNPGTAFTPAGYTWRLVNRTSVNCLDNYGIITNGSGVFQHSLSTTTNQTQRWTITASGSYYKLQCVSGGLYLDTLGNTASGSLVGQESSSSSSNQLWDITSVGSGCFEITSVASGLCLDSFGYATNKSSVGQRVSSGSNDQKWMLIGY